MKKEERVYLDYAATTPVDERVLSAMLPFFREQFGNPSSIHFWGQQADSAVEESRRTIAEILGARAEEIVFTSCGTESDNLALRGAAFSGAKKKGAKHLLISPVEHPAVLNTARQLADDFGFDLEFLTVDQFGMVHPEEVAASIRADTALVSVMHANNEIGTINPIREIGTICQRNGVVFHTDAVQAAAHLDMKVIRDGIDLLALGAHKFYGPKGVGALYVKRGTELIASQTGGKQETGLRGGTQNVPYIVGMAEAFRLTQVDLEDRGLQLSALRDQLIQGVLSNVPDVRLTGHPTERLPNHASFVFEGVDGNMLLTLLDVAGFACSSGSACRVGTPKPSDTLLAIGLPKLWALGSLRVTLGRTTTSEIIDRFLSTLPDLVERARNLTVKK